MHSRHELDARNVLNANWITGSIARNGPDLESIGSSWFHPRLVVTSLTASAAGVATVLDSVVHSAGGTRFPIPSRLPLLERLI